jgi:hypothetical protein
MLVLPTLNQHSIMKITPRIYLRQPLYVGQYGQLTTTTLTHTTVHTLQFPEKWGPRTQHARIARFRQNAEHPHIYPNETQTILCGIPELMTHAPLQEGTPDVRTEGMLRVVQ